MCCTAQWTHHSNRATGGVTPGSAQSASGSSPYAAPPTTTSRFKLGWKGHWCFDGKGSSATLDLAVYGVSGLQPAPSEGPLSVWTEDTPHQNSSTPRICLWSLTHPAVAQDSQWMLQSVWLPFQFCARCNLNLNQEKSTRRVAYDLLNCSFWTWSCERDLGFESQCVRIFPKILFIHSFFYMHVPDIILCTKVVKKSFESYFLFGKRIENVSNLFVCCY